MKQLITIAIMLLCMLTGGYCQNNDRTSNMRSSSTRSTVNNNNVRNNKPARSYGGNNMHRSGITGGMRSGFTSSFSGNRNSSPQRRDNSAKNERTRKQQLMTNREQ